jgi:hypothetical protein
MLQHYLATTGLTVVVPGQITWVRSSGLGCDTRCKHPISSMIADALLLHIAAYPHTCSQVWCVYGAFGGSAVDGYPEGVIVLLLDMNAHVLHDIRTRFIRFAYRRQIIRALSVHQDLGPISVVFWNPYSTPAPLLTATPEQLQTDYNVTVTG